MCTIRILLFAAAIPAVPVHAETQLEIAQKCLEATSSGDVTVARALAVAITEWPPFAGTELREAALKCVVENLGDGWSYSFGKLRIISAEELASLEAERVKSNETAASERKRKLDEQAATKRSAEEEAAKKRLVALEVEQAVYQACTEIFLADSNAALTNEVCIQRFKILGLPER